jgi:translation initiation factor IF-3
VYIISRELLINEQIDAKKVRLIGSGGDQVGIVPLEEALDRAAAERLDLALVSPQANPPVCKIMNYGKYKYEQSKREREARKKQHVVNLKEIRMSPTIEEHDLNTKARHAIKFLENGDKVKVTIRFRGRQIVHSELGKQVLKQMEEKLADYGKRDTGVQMEGRHMSIIYSPDINKGE